MVRLLGTWLGWRKHARWWRRAYSNKIQPTCEMLHGILGRMKLETRASKIREWNSIDIPTWNEGLWLILVESVVWVTNLARSMQCNLLLYSLPCRRTRHRESPNREWHRKLHDRFIALDRYTKGENVFLHWRSKLSWISGVKRLWEELLQELDRLGDLLQDRSERRQLISRSTLLLQRD